jgi:transcription-repair coupling factor (superfamily II helicase)
MRSGRKRERGAPRVVPDAEYPTYVKLRVGEVVVYGNHGIGRVSARKAQTVLGEQRDVVVIELENDPR